jgi:hypothetical protein
VYLSATNNVSIATNSTQRLLIDAAGQIEAVSLGSAAAPTFSWTGDPNTGIYSPGADQLAISTNGTGRLFVDASGNVGVGGSTATGVALRVVTNNTGSSQIYAVTSEGTIASDVTGTARLFYTAARTSASSFTLTNLRHYDAEQGTFGAGSTVTNQYGYHVNNLTGATNNFGFYSNIASGTGRWNFYSNGTADSYFASNNFIWANGGTERARIDSSGRLLVGTSSDSGGALLQVNGNRIRIATAKTPASATDTGTAGEICWDANYIYVCTATNTWKRTAISTW